MEGNISSKMTSRMIIVIVYVVAFFNQGSCSGEFQVNLLSFINDNGRTSEGSCCSTGPRHKPTLHDDVTPEQFNASCERTCRTYFRVCLSHYQADIPLDGPCTWAERETDAIVNNSYVWRTTRGDVNLTAANVIRLPIKFSWPEGYSIIIEAWHHDHSQEESKPRRLPQDLIFRYATQQLLKPSQSWSYTQSSSNQSKLSFSYRITCDKDYYGEGCEVHCVNRNDKFGHFRCIPEDGSRVCLDGWTGEFCDKVVCSPACHPVHSTGVCVKPNECQCRMGWEGKQCDQCIRYPGCKRGTCQKPWQCNCDEGWGGQFCNQDLNFCTTYKPCMNGAACINSGQGSYTCACKEGFTGTNCEIKLAVCTRETCLNNGICQLSTDGRTSQCKCPAGFYGRRCEAEAVNSCREGSCSNGATCLTISATQHHCVCPAGYNGLHCEVEIDECHSQPCLNGGRCVDDVGSFQCVCPRGFSGALCQQNINDCALSPCLHDATCRDKIDDFECICKPGYTGALCQDRRDPLVDACTASSCANGATCRPTSSNGGFRCICPVGFTGRLCEVNVNDCHPGLCLNGGTCIDLVNDFECVCARGYHGNRCSDNEDRISEIIDNKSNQSASSQAIVVSSDKNETLTLKQIVLVVALGVSLSVVLLALAVTLLALRRRRRLARVKRDNLKNETKFMNNRQVYPGDENVQVAFSDKIYTKNAINFDDDDRRTENKSCHYAQVHEWKKVSQNTRNKLSRKEVNSVTTNVPLLFNERGHSIDSLKHINESLSSKDDRRKYNRDDVNKKSNNHLESLLNLDSPSRSHVSTTTTATDTFSFSMDV